MGYKNMQTMSYLESIYLQYSRIKERLQDEESKEIFDMRVEYFLKNDAQKLEAFMESRAKEWTCPEVEKFLKKHPERDIKFILFGAGYVGRKTKRYLEMCGYHPIAFCDNGSAVGQKVDNLPVISVKNAMNHPIDTAIIISSLKYRGEMYQQLLENNYDSKRILVPGAGVLEIVNGWQYFDVFSPEENEIFLDVGGYNGNTTKDFFMWAKNAKKSYIFEPHPALFDEIRHTFEKESRVIVYNYAASDKEESQYFKTDETPEGKIWGGSRISEKGTLEIKTKKIDTLCECNDKITFIKMDVEGSELQALMGAKNIICRDKPKLAISLYHKPEDIFDLPDYILSLVNDYKFYIRHYTAGLCETVLYAIAE